ncbi:FGFR1 oncogene partner isoform X10 [Ictalurus furcatus]|uniref:FGFR1 oncogene partner isoform X10 n=1 Tax=Ictalurus furcatus TaxID=66913 RepID=UPI00234FE0F0|nr:FGFR1 oncogene partner isoform X10 [Ictalurus furcatus]
MSATEEDTELRDLLIQNLENNGVLNKIKAELRAAVFLALEEQDKVENKTPLVNENLKKCLSTKDGRLVASLITDFLQVFNLDFTLAVFQPEINTVNGLDTREGLSKELGFSESEGNKSTPLLLELIKGGRNKEKFSIFSEADRATHIPKEPSPRQISEAQRCFDSRRKDRSGGLVKEEVLGVFSELFPSFSRGMLERFVADELGAKDISNSVDFQEFSGLFKQLYLQCRSVVASDVSVGVHPVSKVTEEKISPSPTSKIPRYKGFRKASAAQEEPPGPQAGEPPSHCESLISQKSRAFVASEGFITGRDEPAALRRPLDLGLEDDDDEEGDSFFDDPLPKPQKTYGCLSAIGSDTEGEGEDMFSDAENKPSTNSESRRVGSAKAAGITPPAPTDTPPLTSAENNQKDPVSSKDGIKTCTHLEIDYSYLVYSESKVKGVQDIKTLKEKAGSPLPTDEELDYDDDFNSHNSKSELSISEEIEEASVEGPDLSDKLEEITQDVSVSQTSQAADYMEDVA